MSGDELVDIVDEEDRVVGRATRAEMRRANLLHRNVAILCRDRAGRIYIHRRSPTKDVYPSRYDMFTAGVVASGETYAAAAVRELAEELGITGVQLEALFRHRYADEHTRTHTVVYRVEWNGPITHQASEIDWGGYRTREQLVLNREGFDFVPDGVELFTRYIAEYPTD